jgi:hypothetical protein
VTDPLASPNPAANSSSSAKLTSFTFPVLRWLALAWLAIWFPAYWHVWGWQNFLHYCDIAVILSCAGIIFGNRLLISSQALATSVAGIVWFLDAGWRVVFHHNLIGGTEYLWDATKPLWVRLLSLFHIGLPILLVVLCARIGYDRRALALQSAITLGLMAISRWIGSAKNLNYTFFDPVLHRTLGPSSVHLAIILAGTVLLFYLPAHIVLARKFSGRKNSKRAS